MTRILRLSRWFQFLRRERLYLLLLTFVILVSVLAAIAPDEAKKKPKAKAQTLNIVSPEEAGAERAEEDLFTRREEFASALREKPSMALLYSLASLLIIAVFFLGVAIDMALISAVSRKKRIHPPAVAPAPVRWDIWDVCRVGILFLFFGYMVIFIEGALVRDVGLFKNDNFRMMINSSILDVLTVVFILYFTARRYKEPIASLGLSLKGFMKNVFRGVVGYIATVPALIGALAVIIFIINVTKYVPERQPVVELFLKEESAPFLLYSSIFASIVGPFIEELFFRGFMYNAFKKRMGVLRACLITAAAFAALHTNVVGFVPIMILGLLLTYLYERTGTLVSSITVHIIHNLSMVFLVFLVKQAGG